MAGGKLTPRQKMINLMYLVFIAMLALNMSKEVLSAFGLMNEKFEASNKEASTSNESLYSALADKAKESGGEYAQSKQLADKVKPISANFVSYIESLKGDITKDIEKENGKLPYEAMDKGDKIDELWFEGDGYSAKGKEIVATIEKYKSDMKALLGGKYKNIVNEIDAKFNTSDVVDREGTKKLYLDYHYKGFPAIASLTKLSAMQNDVRTIEASLYSSFLGGAALETASMSKYQAIVVTEKSAFFAGEPVKGRVYLGRYDESTVPTAVSVAGASTKIENGQAVFTVGAGAVGEHDITGKFTFVENGKNIDIPIKGNYVVVPKPNSATISADKMNSVYRGVKNPMTISFAGIADNNVTASAPGLTKGGKPGQYVWNVTGLSGTSAVVTVSGTLPDGSKVSDKKTFNIRPIPQPVPTLRGKAGSGKGNKNDLSSSTINVTFPDFVFDLTANVQSFEVYVPGSPAIICQGNRFSGPALAAINKTKRGDVVVINNIETTISGADGYRPPRSTSFAWEIQ